MVVIPKVATPFRLKVSSRLIVDWGKEKESRLLKAAKKTIPSVVVTFSYGLDKLH